jgi:hypothetical protein
VQEVGSETGACQKSVAKSADSKDPNSIKGEAKDAAFVS